MNENNVTMLATTGNDYTGLTMATSPADAMKRLQQLQAFVKEVMREGIDYGTIPGTDKPTLLQPGAQMLCEIYGFAQSFQDVRCIEDWDKPLFHYEVKCVLTSRRDESFVGDGIGSCNSKEKKYVGRWAFENEIPAGLAKNTLKRREGKSKKNGRPYTQFFIPNDEIFSLVNTIKKMACKRALVMAVIGATRSSGLFTQDVEDLPEEAFTGGSQKPATPPPNDKQQEAQLFTAILNDIMSADTLDQLGEAKKRIVRARNERSLPAKALEELIDAGTQRKADIEGAAAEGEVPNGE